jgi:fructokinase
VGVLVIGEALIDVVRSRDGSETRFVGGSPLNVAVALGRLGEAVTFLSSVGDDRDGDLIAAHLAESGVALAQPRAGLTSTAIATVGDDGSAEYEFDIHWALDAGELPEASITHTGSIAMFLEPGASQVREWIRAGTGGLVSIDPNIRPALLGTPGAARAQFEEILPYVDIVKLSDEDAHWLYPDVDPVVVMRSIQDSGVDLVALTRGERGTLLLAATSLVDLPAHAVTVKDTIGAGDSFMGALLYGVARDAVLNQKPASIPEHLLTRIGGFAATAAAITVSRQGADPPTLAEVLAEHG